MNPPTEAQIRRRIEQLEKHLRALVDSCTPLNSRITGETKFYGAQVPNKRVLENARKVCT